MINSNKNNWLHHLPALAYMCGINDYRDLKPWANLIKNSESILEIGAGYGRVLDYILSIRRKGKLSAIEINSHLADLLKVKYKNKVKVTNGNLLDKKNYQTKSHDLVLWMWGSILHINSSLLCKAFLNIYSALIPNGILIIDIPPSDTYAINRKGMQKIIGRKIKEVSFLEKETILIHTNNIGLKLQETYSYISGANTLRHEYVLKKEIK